MESPIGRRAVNDTAYTKLVSLRIPYGDIAKLSTQAKERGTTKTRIILDGLRLAIESQTETAQSADPVK